MVIGKVVKQFSPTHSATSLLATPWSIPNFTLSLATFVIYEALKENDL
jgi:hypothetical protein